MLELKLVRDGAIIFNMPLACERTEGFPDNDISEKEIEKLASIYSLGSNPRRLRIMRVLANRSEMKFSELMDFAMNPKLLRDCVGPMIEEGMVIHEEKGSGYRAASGAFPLFLTLTLGVRAIISALEEDDRPESRRQRKRA